jgi:ribonuclease HI
LVTGDLRYHDAERAADLGLALLSIPHESLESWALRRWCHHLAGRLSDDEVHVHYSEQARSPWRKARPVKPSTSENRDAWEVTRLFDLEEAGGAGPTEEEKVAAVPSGPEVRDEPPVFVLRVDGGSRGNPGPSAIGVVLENDQGVVLEEIGARIGTATNNQAEYQALITGLETALDRGVAHLCVLSDSELLVRQLRQEYKVRSEGLKELFLQVSALVREFDRVEIRHVPREENAAADSLVNQALDGKI